jgi:MFS transporter, putative metabolite:H+ symporter
MPTSPAAAITARLDRLPSSPYLWRLLVLLSLGGFFEIYDLFLTAYVTPGLVREGIFKEAEKGLFGLSDQATFASVMFGGLFIGTIVFGWVADRFGRRAIFTFSLLWYAAATLIMAFQTTRTGVNLWRFIAGIGVGVELVTIDTYLTELMPKGLRGRAFAINQAIQFLAAPVGTFLAWQLVPIDPFGISGWRIVVLVPVVGALIVWWIRREVPESPRWLAQRGRIAEAEGVTSAIEARISAETGQKLPAPGTATEETGSASFSEMWKPPYGQRTVMLSVFNFFQTIGFYGFANWVPQLIAAEGVTITKSLQYSFIIALAYPVGPLLCSLFADRIERKWQICIAALGTGTFGLLFGAAPRSGAGEVAVAAMIIILGILITTTNNLLSYAYHAYQAELFPTRIRARAVGFVYSFSRLSTVFTSFMIAFFLQNFGAPGVFLFIAFAMAVVIVSIGVFGPRTNNRALEEISATA